MKFTADEPKRLANLDKHGFDLNDAAEFGWSDATIVPTREGRSIAIGSFRDQIVSIVFKPMGSEAIAIISMRPASHRERVLHGH